MLGSRENPISRESFIGLAGPYLDASKDDGIRFRKVTPTLVLYPHPTEAATEPMNYEMNADVQTFLSLSGTGQTFAEAMLTCHNKALLMNCCTPFLEVYPKDKDECDAIYDMTQVDADIVPETGIPQLTGFLAQRVQAAQPLVPFAGINANNVALAMGEYRNALGRQGVPWRVATNKSSTTCIAKKMTRDDLSAMLLGLGRVAPYAGERLFRQESYTPAYEFGEGDYCIIDIDPKNLKYRLDKDGLPVVRTVNAAVFEATHAFVPLGEYYNPISRKLMVPNILPLMQSRKETAPGVPDLECRYIKVAPTLVLYPNAEELSADGTPGGGGMNYQVADDLRIMLKVKTGQSFEEAMMKVHGKALLLNFCTPYLEVYPKDKKHCADIYNMEQVDADTVPEQSVPDLANYIRSRLQDAAPMVPYVALNAERVAQAMVEYRNGLGRGGLPWRMAFNKSDVTAVAFKLKREDLATLLTGLGRTAPWMGERLYREESFSPTYEFGEGDYILMDVDPQTNNFKLDKDGYPLVRTVNEGAFESTYNTVASRARR